MGISRSFYSMRPVVAEMVKRQRSRPKWHDEYLALEDICWSIFSGNIRVRHSQDHGDGIQDLVEETYETTCQLRESMEAHLPGPMPPPSKVAKIVRKAAGAATHAVLASGPFEENAEYLRYGILDLVYQLSFRIRHRSRPKCFAEFLMVIRIVLERSPATSILLHAKATDIWNRILELGNKDSQSYGEATDREAIQRWIDRHGDKAEDPELSAKYFPIIIAHADRLRRSQRIVSHLRKLRSEEEDLVKGANGISDVLAH
jgi:hypothetical protein